MRIGPLKLKAQIFCGDENAMGPGKADLLAAIDRHGSISAAARALGMSYRRAWLLVDEMNRCWAERVVETGSGKGRGAWLSPAGRHLLDAYRSLESRIAEAAEREAPALLQGLRPAPLPTKGAQQP